MALSGSVIERFAEASGALYYTIDKVVRYLRAAGLVTSADPGRPRKQGSGRIPRKGHFESLHLTNVILAFAGPQPSDAADAVKVLRPLVFESSEPPTGASYFGTGDLGSLLDKIIDQWGTWYADDEGDVTVTLHLSPPGASLMFVDKEGVPRNERFGEISSASVCRQTVVRSEVFRAAATLCADKTEHRRRKFSRANLHRLS